MKKIRDSLFVFFCFCGGGLFYKYQNKPQAKGTVLLVHGFLVNSLTFRPMASFLNRKGYNVYLPKLGWNIWRVKKQASKLEKYWRKQKINPKLPLYVVGHSMGGLIAEYWMTKYKIKPHKFITLGTPFLGSRTVYWGIWYFFPATKDLLPRAKTLSYVLKKTDFEQVNLIAKEDLLVEPASGLCAEIKAQKIQMHDVGGHAGLIVDKRSFQRVLSLLK